MLTLCAALQWLGLAGVAVLGGLMLVGGVLVGGLVVGFVEIVWSIWRDRRSQDGGAR